LFESVELKKVVNFDPCQNGTRSTHNLAHLG